MEHLAGTRARTVLRVRRNVCGSWPIVAGEDLVQELQVVLVKPSSTRQDAMSLPCLLDMAHPLIRESGRCLTGGLGSTSPALGLGLCCGSGGTASLSSLLGRMQGPVITGSSEPIDLVQVYPTMAEALRIVALWLFRDVSKMSDCAE